MASQESGDSPGARRALLGLCCLLAAAVAAGCRPAPEPRDAGPEETQPLLTIQGFTGYVRCVAFSPDGQRLAAIPSNGEVVKVYDAATSREVFTIGGENFQADDAAFSPDGMRLALAGGSKTHQVYDAGTGEPTLGLEGGRPSGAHAVAFSPDGTRLAMGGEVEELGKRIRSGDIQGHTVREYYQRIRKGIVTLYDAATGKRLLEFEAHEGVGVTRLAFSNDSKRLATLGPNGLVKVWDAKAGKELLALQARTRSIMGLAYSPDGAQLATAPYNFPYNGPPFDTRLGPPPARAYEDPAKVQVWDPVSGEELFLLPGHRRTISCLTYSADGRFLASGSSDRMVKVWDTKERNLVVTLSGHPGTVYSLRFSPDDKRLVAGTEVDTGAGEVWIWDVARHLTDRQRRAR